MPFPSPWRQHLAAILFTSGLIYGGLLLVPIYVRPIEPGLDASCAYALNYFLHTGLKFGPDFVVTFGPLGFLTMPAHVAYNLQIAMAVRFVVWGIVLWQLVAMWRTGNRIGATVLLTALAVCHVVYRHFWEELVGALVLILYVRLLREGSRVVELLLVVFFTGFLFLLKFSAFVPAALIGRSLARYRLTPPRVSWKLCKRSSAK
jgi:hypothetical protein